MSDRIYDLNAFLKTLADTANKDCSEQKNEESEAFYDEANQQREQELHKREQELHKREQEFHDRTQELHREQILNEQQEREQRKKLTSALFHLTVWVMIIVVGLILGTGIAHLIKKDYLSDAILITLISFAGVNMLGTFAIILTYLFNKQK